MKIPTTTIMWGVAWLLAGVVALILDAKLMGLGYLGLALGTGFGALSVLSYND